MEVFCLQHWFEEDEGWPEIENARAFDSFDKAREALLDITGQRPSLRLDDTETFAYAGHENNPHEVCWISSCRMNE